MLGIDAGGSDPGSEVATLHGLYWVLVNLSLEAPVLRTVEACTGATVRRTGGFAI